MTDREALKLALEALEEMGGGYSQNLIAALKERLAQPEQEPVSEMLLIDEATVELALEALENVTKDYVENRQRTHNRAIEKLSKVFVQKPQRKPLTKKQCLHLEVHPLMTIEQVVRIVEAAHNIKGEA